MKTRDRQLARIERMELHAAILLAKAGARPPRWPPKATSSRVKTAERLAAKARQLRNGLTLTDEARRKERELRERQGRQPKKWRQA